MTDDEGRFGSDGRAERLLERLAAGELSALERRELADRSAADPELARRVELYRPLDEAEALRTLPSPEQVAPRRPMRGPAIGVVFAAAVVALLVVRSVPDKLQAHLPSGVVEPDAVVVLELETPAPADRIHVLTETEDGFEPLPWTLEPAPSGFRMTSRAAGFTAHRYGRRWVRVVQGSERCLEDASRGCQVEDLVLEVRVPELQIELLAAKTGTLGRSEGPRVEAQLEAPGSDPPLLLPTSEQVEPRFRFAMPVAGPLEIAIWVSSEDGWRRLRTLTYGRDSSPRSGDLTRLARRDLAGADRVRFVVRPAGTESGDEAPATARVVTRRIVLP